MRRALSAGIFMFMLGISATGLAQPFSESQVPDPLKAWIPWAKYGIENNTCPFTYDNPSQKTCLWPTKLALDLKTTGGTFTYSITVYDTPEQKPQPVRLPGNADTWPQDVKLDGKQALVLSTDDEPALLLKAGSYQITGSFRWDSLPDSLKIPESVGLVQLAVDGHGVAIPNIRGDEILLGNDEKKTAEPEEENRVDAKLFREVEDGIPLLLVTDIRLEVAGKQREEDLGKILPEGFVPVNVESEPQVRLEKDGTLHAQLRPGTWNITITARAPADVTSLALPPKGGILPAQEIWSFKADNNLRLADVEGVPLIDPSQAELPQEWGALPSYLMTRDSHFTLVEKKRGMADSTPDELNLVRDIWLDSSGTGYTFEDSIIGQIHKSSRLEVEDGIALGNATINGKQQYITTIGDKGSPGVEVREGYINLAAGSRLNSDTADFPATGWKSSFNNVVAHLYLPPGWTLFYYSGADKASPTWVGRWSLLDIFLVMLAVVSVFKLYELRMAALAATSLVLMQHELSGFTPLVLTILAGAAILRYLQEGILRKTILWWQRLLCLWLVCAVLPFSVQHLREAIYPQLKPAQGAYEESYNAAAGNSFMDELKGPAMEKKMPERAVMEEAPPNIHPMELPVAVPPPAPPMMASPLRSINPRHAVHHHKHFNINGGAAAGMAMGKVAFSGSAGASAGAGYENYAPDTKVQTGFGTPSGRDNAINITWNGTVDPSMHLSLRLVSARDNMIIAFVRVLATLLLVALLLPIPRRGTGNTKAKTLSAATAILAVCTLLPAMFPGAVRAEYDAAVATSPSLMDELKHRLSEAINEPPACAPMCATIAHTKITVADNALTLLEEVHAAENIALPLPGGTDSWRPSSVTVDDKPAGSLTENNGFLYVNLTRGVHQVKVAGGLPRERDTMGISLPVAPHYTSYDAAGWDVQGIHENGMADKSIQFTRTQKHAAEGGEAPEKSFTKTVIEPFYQLERRFVLGAKWQVFTTVRRITPADEPAVVEIPLLNGETITTEKIKVKDAQVQASFDPQVDSVSWQSVMDPVPEFGLISLTDKPWTSLWQLGVSNLWHVKVDGPPRVPAPGNDTGLWQWQPRPGESLHIHVTRPAGVDGPTSTVDASILSVTPGLRSQDMSLDLTVRSSLGGQYDLALPENAVLDTVLKGAEILPSELRKGVLSLPLSPGENDFTVRWKETQDMPVVLESPAVKLSGTRSVNAKTDVQMPPERWILYTSGPVMGPAVLFWSWLPVVIILAFGLSKVPGTPLRLHQWFLLLLGLSQASIIADLTIIGWLLAFEGRRRVPEVMIGSWVFYVIQVALVLLTVTSLSLLFDSIRMGLLGTPDMHITGNGSSGSALYWYQDITGNLLPQVCVVSVSIWVYRILMLLWSLWLAFSLVSWLRSGWNSFTLGGYWDKKESSKA